MENFQKYNVINYSTTLVRVGAAGPGRAMGAAWAPRHLSILQRPRCCCSRGRSESDGLGEGGKGGQEVLLPQHPPPAAAPSDLLYSSLCRAPTVRYCSATVQYCGLWPQTYFSKGLKNKDLGLKIFDIF